MVNKVKDIKDEIKKVIVGKDQVIDKVLMVILAKGHILLEDIPGVGKTTLALGFSKSMDMDFNRVQFTPDVVPSDITGFSMFNKGKGEFEYKEGAAMCNLFLGDEINRTSSKTQSALLEIMEEGRVTVDGITHEIPKPFTVMATQNPLGTAGTQRLPEAQLDRFMVQLEMGYPSFEAQVNILKDRQKSNPLELVKPVVTKDQVVEIQNQVSQVFVDDKIYEYVTRLTEETRKHQLIKLGVSPRGAIAVCAMAKAGAYVDERNYVVPNDVKDVFVDVCRHRIILNPKSQLQDMNSRDVLIEILEKIDTPEIAKI